MVPSWQPIRSTPTAASRARTSRSSRSMTAVIPRSASQRRRRRSTRASTAWRFLHSGVGIETLPIYEDAGLVPIRLTSDNDTAGFGFTLQPMSSQIAPTTSGALTDWIGASTVAIAFDPTENYTDEVARAVKAQLESDGVEVTAFEQIQPGGESYSGW